MEQEILELTQKWYEIVSRDMHKDRDCHFTIEKRWSYGQPPTYVVQHDGYIYETWECAFTDAETAHRFLVSQLKEMIESEESYDRTR